MKLVSRLFSLISLTIGIGLGFSGILAQDPGPVLSFEELKRELSGKPPERFPLIADFVQTKTLKSPAITLQTSGKLLLLADGLEWKILKPATMNFRIKEGRLEILSQDQKQEVPSAEFKVLTAALKLDPAEINQIFLVSKISALNYWIVPREIEKWPFRRMKLKINKQARPTSIQIEEKSGELMQIQFKNFRFKE